MLLGVAVLAEAMGGVVEGPEVRRLAKSVKSTPGVHHSVPYSQLSVQKRLTHSSERPEGMFWRVAVPLGVVVAYGGQLGRAPLRST